MPTCKGLPGTKRDKDAVLTRKVSELGRIIRAGKCATTADDHGAISAWVDDAGQYRCEAYRFMRTVDSQILTNMKAVVKWWREWLKKIQTGAAPIRRG